MVLATYRLVQDKLECTIKVLFDLCEGKNYKFWHPFTTHISLLKLGALFLGATSLTLLWIVA
ncbi:MAG: hypothetical protein AAF242_21055, partial [Bacteroidota bacterium]